MPSSVSQAILPAYHIQPLLLIIFNYFISKIIFDFLSNTSLKQNLLASTMILTKPKCVLRAAVDILTDKSDGAEQVDFVSYINA